MTRFSFNHRTFDVPKGIGIEVVVGPYGDLEEGEADFNFVKDGEHIPMLGGTDEHGNEVPNWNDVGIRELT